jgi:hypothetical protein
VGHREVDEGQPEHREQHEGREAHPLREGADDEGRRDHREGHLEADVDVFRDHDAVREGGRDRGRVDAAQEGLREAAHEVVEAAAVGEGEAVAVEHPDEGRDARDGEDLREQGEHVLGAHEAAVEQGEARHDHEKNEDGGEHHPGGVALIEGGGRSGLRERWVARQDRKPESSKDWGESGTRNHREAPEKDWGRARRARWGWAP